MKIISENRKVTAILLSLALMLSAVLCIGIILTSCDDNFDLSKETSGTPGTSTPTGTSDNVPGTSDTSFDTNTDNNTDIGAGTSTDMGITNNTDNNGIDTSSGTGTDMGTDTSNM